MKFYLVHYPDNVPHGLPSLVHSREYVGGTAPTILKKYKLLSAAVEEWDLITRDTSVLLRTGTVYATRRLTWHRARA